MPLTVALIPPPLVHLVFVQSSHGCDAIDLLLRPLRVSGQFPLQDRKLKFILPLALWVELRQK